MSTPDEENYLLLGVPINWYRLGDKLATCSSVTFQRERCRINKLVQVKILIFLVNVVFCIAL